VSGYNCFVRSIAIPVLAKVRRKHGALLLTWPISKEKLDVFGASTELLTKDSIQLYLVGDAYLQDCTRQCPKANLTGICAAKNSPAYASAMFCFPHYTDTFAMLHRSAGSGVR